VIYFNDRREVCEAAYSNLWILKGDRLQTPPVTSPCLPGIVRKQVLQEGVALGLEVLDDQPVTREKLAAADEVFLTSSIRGIQRVSGIDEIWQQQKIHHAALDVVSRLVTSLSMG
jgi:branched-chain amino acid aminotransferase